MVIDIIEMILFLIIGLVDHSRQEFIVLAWIFLYLAVHNHEQITYLKRQLQLDELLGPDHRN